MFKKKTTFILGAGASYGYGFPLGNQLIKDIKKAINSISVILPIKGKIEIHRNNGCIESICKGNHKATSITNEKIITFDDIENLSITHDTLNIFKIENTDQHTFLRNKDIHLLKIKLNGVEVFKNLRDKLETYTSIDHFIYENPSYEIYAKIMVVYCILMHENKNLLSDKIMYENNNHFIDLWYTNLLTDITTGCKDFEDVLKNNINIITFNYDQSLEYNLIKRFYYDSDNLKCHTEENLIKLLKKIYHVYGSIHSLKNKGEIKSFYNNYGCFFSKGNVDIQLIDKNKEVKVCNCFLYAMKNYNNIDTVRYEFTSTNDIKPTLLNSEKVNILGYAFDPFNNNVISLNSTKPDAVIAYLNFDKYQNIDRQLKQLYRYKNNDNGEKLFVSYERSMSRVYMDICKQYITD